MGSPYQSQSASGYNSSPPPDDGSTVAANKITWATIKSKLPDPLKVLADAINTALRSALNVTPSTTSTTYTTLVGDHLTTIEVTGTTTVSLGDAATMIAQSMGYTVTVYNKGTALVTVALATGTNKLNGVTNGTLTLPPFCATTFTVAQSGTDYEVVGASKPYRQGADIVSAATLNLDAASDGDYVHVTGTTTITAITLQKGDEKTIEFTGILTFTNGASLILPGGANITTAAGDTAVVRGEAAGVVRCIAYTKASGLAVSAGGASMVFLGSKICSSSASATFAHLGGTGDVLLDFTAYDEYEFHFVNFVPATNAVNLQFQISQNSGTSYISTATYTNTQFVFNGTTSSVSSNNGVTANSISPTTQANTGSVLGLSLVLVAVNPANNGLTKAWYSRNSVFITSGAVFSGGSVVCAQSSTSPYTGIKFLYDTGNIASGTVYCYGIKKS